MPIQRITENMIESVNANTITAGTLSTDRYSAYDDLVAESKIGTGSSQVSPGSHSLAAHSVATNNVQFGGYMAIAMSCDNGATLPASPTTGQWFLHTPTGRKWLMMYDGSAWRAMMGFGTTTLYVDGSSGTNGMNYGFGTGTNAFRTIQYALNNAPSKNFGGSIYIYPSSGTYAEDLSISGIDVSGGNLVIAGSLATYSSGTITSGVQGSGSTQASITDSSASWTTNEHRGRFVVVGGDTLPITGNSATTLYCAGRFSSTPSGSYTIKYPGVVIKSIRLDNRQVLQLQDMEVRGSSFNNLYLYSWSKLLMYRCKISATSGYYNASIQYSWLQSYYSAWIANNNFSVVAQDWSKVYFSGCLVYQLVGTKSTGSGIFLQNSTMTNPDGLFVENFNKAVDATNSSMAQMYSATIYNFIYNNNYGVYASNHSKVMWTSRCAFSGNTTDSYADSATYGLTSATG